MHMSREAHGAREPLTATSPSWTPSRLKVPRRTTQKKTKNNPRTCMARSVRYSSDKEFGLEVQICRFGGLERKQVTFYSALQLFTCRTWHARRATPPLGSIDPALELASWLWWRNCDVTRLGSAHTGKRLLVRRHNCRKWIYPTSPILRRIEPNFAVGAPTQNPRKWLFLSYYVKKNLCLK